MPAPAVQMSAPQTREPQAPAPIEALPAEALRIAEWERAALIDLVPRLEAGELAIDMAHDDTMAAEGDSLVALVARHHPLGLTPFRYLSLAKPEAGGCSRALAPLFIPGFGTKRMLAHPGWRANGRAAALAARRFLAGRRAACWDGFLGGV